jgi:hypothetical protein
VITVSLAVLALTAWFAMIVFAVVPKGLTLTDLFFLYFLIGIMTITLFTILDVNLHLVPLTRRVEGSFAMYICRFIVIPIEILLSACVMLSPLNAKMRWGLFAVILVILCAEDRLYLWAELMTYRKWNECYSALMYGAFMVLVWRIARWFVGLDRGGFQKHE